MTSKIAIDQHRSFTFEQTGHILTLSGFSSNSRPVRIRPGNLIFLALRETELAWGKGDTKFQTSVKNILGYVSRPFNQEIRLAEYGPDSGNVVFGRPMYVGGLTLPCFERIGRLVIEPDYFEQIADVRSGKRAIEEYMLQDHVTWGIYLSFLRKMSDSSSGNGS